MAREKKRVRVTGIDKDVAAEHNRHAVLDFIMGAKDEALADMIFENIADLENISGSIDWDEARDAIMEGRGRGKQTRSVAGQVLAQAKDGDLDKLKIKGLNRATPMDAAIERTEKRIKFENQYGHASATLMRGIERAGKSLINLGKFNLGSSLAYGLGSAGDLLYGSRLHAQKTLGIAPFKGAIIGTLMTTDALLGAAAFAASPQQMEISNAHMLSAFQQACISSGTPLNAAYDIAFSPESNSKNNGFAYYTMKVAETHNVPPLALHLISYLESKRHTDMIANNSTASNYFQVLDLTKFDYLKQYGRDTQLYQAAKAAIENNTAKTDDRLLVMAVDAVRGENIDNLKQMLKSKTIPDDIYAGLVLADTPMMQAELIAIDMAKKTEIASAQTPDEILDITADYYREHHFLGAGNYNVLQMLDSKFSATAINSAYDVLGYNSARNMENVVAGNPGLLKDGMTAREALESIKSNFRQIVGPAYEKFLANYDPQKSVIETCLPDFTRAQANIHAVSKGEYTVRLFAQAYTALTPSFIKQGFEQAGEAFGASTNLTPKKMAQTDAPLPKMRPDYL